MSAAAVPNESAEQVAWLPSALLPALLEQIPSAALVIANGRVIAANDRARSELDRDPERWTQAVRSDGRPEGSVGFRRVASLRGAEEFVLLVSDPRETAMAELLLRAKARWRLTPRQVEVLGLIGEGATNRQIASSLGCAERTVHVHVSTLLQKSGCDTRSQLVSELWRLR